MKYVTITNGSLGFYDTNVHTTIPSGAYEITDADYTTFFSDQGKYTFEVQDSKAVLVELTTVYFASDHGITVVPAMSNMATPSGAVKFTSQPTESDLSAAFPSVASSRTFTVTANATSGDTITMFSTTVTFGTDITVEPIIADTVTNLVNYMNAQERLLGNYRLTSSGDTFTLTERFAGGDFDIPVPTTTGTMVISAGKLTESVWGYTTQVKHDAKVALEASAETIREEYRKNYIGAMAAGNTTLASSILADISSLNASLYTAMQQINDEE